MKITVESVFSVQYSRGGISHALGDLYLNGELKAWIGFMGKVVLEAKPGENTVEISYKNARNGSKKIKFYATEDVNIFIRLEIRGMPSTDVTVNTLALGNDLKIIEEKEIYK